MVTLGSLELIPKMLGHIPFSGIQISTVNSYFEDQ